jgi:hypothetical protein
MNFGFEIHVLAFEIHVLFVFVLCFILSDSDRIIRIFSKKFEIL